MLKNSPKPEDFRVTREKFLGQNDMIKWARFFARHWDEPRWRKRLAVTMIVLASGMRVSELRQIRVPEDASFDGFIRVRRETCKTKTERTVRIPPEFLPWYQEWYKEITQGNIPEPFARSWAPKSVYLIPKRPVIDGKVYSPEVKYKNGAIRRASWNKAQPNVIANQDKPHTKGRLQLMWTEVMVAAHITGAHHKNKTKTPSIHKGRHTKCTWELASRRMTEKEAQDQMGHSTLEMTMEMYCHATAETLFDEDKEPIYRKLLVRFWRERQEAKAKAEDTGCIVKEHKLQPPEEPKEDLRIKVCLDPQLARLLDESLLDSGYESRKEWLEEMIKQRLRKEGMRDV